MTCGESGGAGRPRSHARDTNGRPTTQPRHASRPQQQPAQRQMYHTCVPNDDVLEKVRVRHVMRRAGCERRDERKPCKSETRHLDTPKGSPSSAPLLWLSLPVRAALQGVGAAAVLS